MILDKIVSDTKRRVLLRQEEVSLEMIKEKAKDLVLKETKKQEFLRKRKKGEELSLICEVKKASPSKGVLDTEFPYLKIAKEYERGGAAAISCLTEPEHFLGKDKYLEEIVKEVKIPVLRKDFTVDPYMIYEAKVLGASAILLIVSILGEKELEDYLALANALNLGALVEAHTKEEVKRAVSVGAVTIGVNNRNLKDFTVNLERSIEFREYVPEDRIYIAESGIHTAEDLKRLQTAGVDGVLIGESLMKSQNREEMIQNLLRKGV